jgi:nicotinate-nucleotide adenylyltransferase
MERLGLFGGSFDPVHLGHVAIAAQAAEELRLDQVLFIPAADPPHKRQLGASYGQRLAMLERALADYETFSVSLIEAECPSPSYTASTLLALHQRLGQGAERYFLIGADSLLELHLWYCWQDLLRLTRFIVISRPGIALTAVQEALAQLPGPFHPNPTKRHWQRADGAAFTLLYNRLEENISSSAIRALLRCGKKSSGLDGRVMEYIEQEGLYHFFSPKIQK